MQQEVYFAGGCLWGVQEFFKHLPGIVNTEAGRANGTSDSTQAEYDGYAECVKTVFNSDVISLEQLIGHLFEIIDPYSVNQQGQDIGEKYRTGIYSHDQHHIAKAKAYILNRPDADRITVEVLALTNYVKSDDEHQNRLTRFPNDYCHIPIDLLHKYRAK